MNRVFPQRLRFSLIAVAVFVSVWTESVRADRQTLAEADFARLRDKVTELTRGKSEDDVKKEMAAWKEREPQAPEPYIILANYYLKQTLQPTGVRINATEPGKPAHGKAAPQADQFSIVDPKTGNEVGVLEESASGPKPSEAKIRKYQSAAAEELAAAGKIAPDRLDIMIGRARILSDARSWKALTAQMELALQRAARDPENLRWLENKPLPRSAGDEVLDSLHSRIVDAFNEQSSEGDRRAEQFAGLGLKYFPKSVKLLTDFATARSFSKDWKTARVYYERAASLAKDDSIVLGNLARVYLNLGEVGPARSMANKVIQLNNDDRAVAAAKEILDQLKGRARER